MELQTARQIIGILAQGIHPVTGQAMPEDSPYNAPPVIRALFVAARALEGGPSPAPRKPQPANAGKPWTAADDAGLAAAFEAGSPLKDLAAALGRSAYAVESRLIHLGKLPPRAPGSYRTP